ncbi:Sodium/calcium exchanger protein [Popillia japonica]|uniref:Sodium/calcium exchanger protein n=1 Tax=Popillia japonica TaxID=7064 RepID=A0AAW1L9S2_POPJA
MRRTRRHKFFQISLLFLLYSILHVYSQRSKGVEVEEETVSSTAQSQLSPEILTKTKGNISGAVDTVLKASSNLLNGSVTVTPSTNTPSTPVISTITTRKPTTQESLLHRPTVHTIQKPTTPAPVTARQTSQPKTEIPLSSPTTPLGRTTVPTLRPKRNNCTPPAIEQFPRPLMGPQARRHGGIIIHVLVAVYTFIGLAIVCDEYFVASLDRICEELKLSPDVAGATFMAAGSSAPELATVIIGVFFAKDDIGISGVIGSAVFNIMFVISVCALCTNTVCYLNWWPLVRDCFFYAVSILVMLFTIYNETISC